MVRIRLVAVWCPIFYFDCDYLFQVNKDFLFKLNFRIVGEFGRYFWRTFPF